MLGGQGFRVNVPDTAVIDDLRDRIKEKGSNLFTNVESMVSAFVQLPMYTVSLVAPQSCLAITWTGWAKETQISQISMMGGVLGRVHALIEGK